jgi:hypothetical protein
MKTRIWTRICGDGNEKKEFVIEEIRAEMR